MSFELMTDGGLSEEFVSSQSPSQLRSLYRDLVRQRAARQREMLHIQVSAAAVIADGGKLAKAQDSALSDAAGHSTVRPERPTAAARPSTPVSSEDAAKVDQMLQDVEHLWDR